MKKTLSIVAASILVLGSLSGCTSKKNEEITPTSEQATETEQTTVSENTEAESTEDTVIAGDLQTLIVGASPAPHTEILKAAQAVLKEKGYNLVIKEYTDYVQPNLALDAGDLDANYFQHLPYLEQFNEENKTSLSSAGAIHYEPFGVYAGKTASLEELAEGAKIAVPNDATNEARALLLLETEGLIKLKDGVGLKATKADIIENENNYEILEVEAAQLPRSLQDVDLAVINGNYAIEAGLKVSDALVTEDAQSIAAVTYGNIVAVKDSNVNDEAILALINALTSEEVKTFIEEKYDGAVVPLY